MIELFKPIIFIYDQIVSVLLATLQFFANLTGDYGLAIILLTVAVRVIILPLTIKQTKSMQEMKRLQPKIKELQEKYKKDKQKLQQEIMKFYGEHKVNPLSGCLPLLLQLPIMFALFRVLLELGKDGGKRFLFFINDLSVSAGVAWTELATIAIVPYLVLVLLMIVTTYIPSRMMSTDPQQDWEQEG
ncbi:MAG TPA: YidC/Oxa1 family membrane protein insertase [Actinobacteria bacterium]|nr:YidC/Oxa1 family membrane protein insertase [Actinomycetota bacterium]